jgi:hypothetical protein
MIFGDLVYLTIGFATTFLALEAAWHFTACKIKELVVLMRSNK